SSRRRHTRCYRDWSSDVCSSDLDRPNAEPFLNNVMPEAVPGISGNWSAAVAFTNLTFTNALGLAYVPGTSKLVVFEREGRVWSRSEERRVGKECRAGWLGGMLAH